MEPDLTALLNQTVTIAVYTARDVYGTPAWGAGVEYPARVSGFVPLEQDTHDDAAPLSGVIHMDGNVPVAPGDRITLPDGSTPTIIRVDRFTDDDGSPYATRVVCG